MFIQEMAGGWKLYGKTGNGRYNQTDLQHGWFVGYNRQIVFARHITDSQKEKVFASFRARNETLIKL